MAFASRSLVPTVALAALTAVVAGVAGLTASPAAAHTELLQASPGPGQRAGGEIDFVDLAFLEPVSDARIRVVHDGEEVPGTVVVPDGSIIRFELDEPLATAGRYEVTYQVISFDRDETEGRFSFTYEPGAPQARRIGDPGGPAGRNWVRIVATVVLIASLAGVAFLVLARLESRRRATGPPSPPDGGAESDGGAPDEARGADAGGT